MQLGYLGHGDRRIDVLEQLFRSINILLLNMRYKRWLLVDEPTDEAAKDGRGVVDS